MATRIIDVCTYNGEEELFEIRYNILKDHVDEFRVVEFDKTFSGKDKPKKFNFDLPKVKHYFFDESVYGKYREMAQSHPNTQGADHWKREFMQKESIKDALTDLNDEDICFIGDCDEIWEPKGEFTMPAKILLRVYAYYLNNESSEHFCGIYVSPYWRIKHNCLNELRTEDRYNKTPELYEPRGWHFTSLHHQIRQKLSDSYTKETYFNDWVDQNLEKNVSERKDFLGRNFTYKIDESNWPEYLKENKEKYLHLLYK